MSTDISAFVASSAGLRGIAVDTEDYVYVTSSHRLQKFNAIVDRIKSIGGDSVGQELGQFNEPDGLKLHSICYMCVMSETIEFRYLIETCAMSKCYHQHNFTTHMTLISTLMVRCILQTALKVV